MNRRNTVDDYGNENHETGNKNSKKMISGCHKTEILRLEYFEVVLVKPEVKKISGKFNIGVELFKCGCLFLKYYY
jgi:hypothetical protein